LPNEAADPNGVPALLSLYLELQTLPGNQASSAVAIIDKWRRAQ
jgi:hypothetical protein